MENFLAFVFMGLIVGWLAGILVKGSGFGILGDIVIGILGALLGGWAAGFLGMPAASRLGSFLVALLGSVALVGILRLAVRRV